MIDIFRYQVIESNTHQLLYETNNYQYAVNHAQSCTQTVHINIIELIQPELVDTPVKSPYTTQTLNTQGINNEDS